MKEKPRRNDGNKNEMKYTKYMLNIVKILKSLISC